MRIRDELKLCRRILRNMSESGLSNVLRNNGEKSESAARLYYCENKDKIGESTRGYYDRNKDKKRDYYRQYHLEKDKLDDATRLYRSQYRDNSRESSRQYRMQMASDKKKESNQERYRQSTDRKREANQLYRRENKDKIRASTRLLRLNSHENPDGYNPRDAESKSWRTPATVREYFESIAEQLLIADHADWYRISRIQIKSLDGGSLFTKFESLGSALEFAYPEISWDQEKFAMRGKKSEQRLLRVKIEELLPNVEIVEDFQHPKLAWNRRVELDLWLPLYSIGIEYQGEQHFHNLDLAFGPNISSSLYTERDIAKHSLCQLHGVSLITIPFWWDGNSESLSATLYKSRPDVFPVSLYNPIPTEMPSVESRILSLNRNRSQKKEVSERLGTPVDVE